MSCLFESLSYYVNGVDSGRLRHVMCEFLSTNPSMFDNISVDDITKLESNMPIDQYIENMRKTSTWGGALEIKTFCEIFNIGVDVKSLPNNKLIEFVPSSGNPIGKILITWNGGHFEPIGH